MSKDEKLINFVHKCTIMNETVKKELQFQKLYTQYGINPFAKGCPLAEKPNRIIKDEKGDEHFAQVIRRAALEPTKKYIEPQTENQEYGWISQPLMKIDRSDIRFYHPRSSCKITQFMSAYWKGNEQQRLNS